MEMGQEREENRTKRGVEMEQGENENGVRNGVRLGWKWKAEEWKWGEKEVEIEQGWG